MHTVYLVLTHDGYDHYDLDNIFASRESAEARMTKIIEDNPGIDCIINEEDVLA